MCNEAKKFICILQWPILVAKNRTIFAITEMLLVRSPFEVNFINPLAEGPNAPAHRVGHKRCSSILTTELYPTLPVR